MYDKTESQWVLVQILEDENQPELVGKIMVWKLPKAIFNKMTAKMNPSPESKKSPVPVMDYLIGLPLDLDVAPGPDDPKAPERKQREINYDLCDFDTEYAPIIKSKSALVSMPVRSSSVISQLSGTPALRTTRNSSQERA